MAAQRVLAALGGLAVAFVLVLLFQVVTPDAGIDVGESTVTFERFGFRDAAKVVTAGSVVSFENAGAVPVTVVVEAAGGDNVSLALAPGDARSITLGKEGSLSVRAMEWPWAQSTIEVRSPNPIERFFEDLF